MTVLSEDELSQRLTSFAQHSWSNIPGELLLTRVAGSYSFGCATPDSDVDFMAVYLAPLSHVLSLNPLTETVTHKSPDWKAHEIGKFLRLLMKGNPEAVECLFSPYFRRTNWMFNGLDAMRDDFINQTTLKQYLGYARGQLARLKSHTSLHTTGGDYNTKWAYHLIRLLHDAGRIAWGLPPAVMQSGLVQKQLMDIRQNLWMPNEIEALADMMVSDIDSRKPWPIPEHANEAKLDEWLYKLRLEGLR